MCVLDCRDLEFVRVQEVICGDDGGGGGVSDAQNNDVVVPNDALDDVSLGAKDVTRRLSPADICSNFEPRKDRNTMLEFFENRRRCDLRFDTDADDWSVRIWKERVVNVADFPRVILIEYRTKPCGQSLLWRKNQVCD